MNATNSSDLNREPPEPKKRRKFVLKAVLKAAAKIYAFYRLMSKLYEFLKELAG